VLFSGIFSGVSYILMSFTRFHDDPCRIEKQLQESTGPGRYMLDVPGNGTKPCFMEDPYVRMQKWGANLMTDTINLESELLGMNKRLGRDCVSEAPRMKVNAKKVEYPSCQPFTDQTRATNPAWTALDQEQDNFQFLPLDPQEHTCIPFQNNLNTRLIERDTFKAQPPRCLFNENGGLNYQSYSGTAEPQGLCTRNGVCGSM